MSDEVNIPGFTAEVSLYKTSECYRLATEWIGSAVGQAVIPQAKYCCIMYYPEGWPLQGVAGCRGHDTWRPFAEIGCALEAAFGGYDAYSLRGICSSRPECQGKVLGANGEGGRGPGGPGFGAGPRGSGGGVGRPPIRQL